MLEFFFDVLQIVLADIVLSGDNALIIGMAAASFSEKERKKIIFYGLFAAAALRILFANEGVINNFLTGVGILDQGILFITYDIGLYTGLIYAYILLMMFPLYNAIESLDINQIEAAKDLGSSSFRTHWRIVIPHAKPGIVSGCTMVFMLTVGALATPVVLSSPNTLWFPQLIYQWFNMNDNWSRGSAYSIILLIVSVIFVLTMMRIFKVRIGEIIK